MILLQLIHQCFEFIKDLCFDFRYAKLVLVVLDETEAVGLRCCLKDVMIRSVRVTISDVFLNGLVEKQWFLHHYGYLLSNIFDGEVLNINSIKLNSSTLLVVESQKKRCNRALTRARMSD